MIMPPRPMRMPMRNLFLGRSTHIHYLNIKTQRLPGERMIGVHVR